MNTFHTINPANAQKIQEYHIFNDTQLNSSLEKSAKAYRQWAKTSLSERLKFINIVKEELLKNKKILSEMMTNEMGKPIRQSKQEIEKCALLCDYYTEHSEKFLQNTVIETQHAESYIAYQPLGTILGIMPWNFPFWQFFRFAIPTLIVGNTILLKHALNTTGCALAIEHLFQNTPALKNLVQTIIVDHQQIETLISSNAIQGVSLTGSTEAGKIIAAQAGRFLKKTVLELGGNDPYLVLDDAELSIAVQSCFSGRFLNTGQSCIAAKRLVVVESLYQQFIEKFSLEMQRQKMCVPLSEDCDIGPMARQDLRDKLSHQVQTSLKKGAVSHEINSVQTELSSNGFYFRPMLLKNVTPGMPVFDEETFGPVACIIKAKNESHAIQLANQSRYGLGAAVFTQNIEKAKHIADHQLNAGFVAINGFVKSNPYLPFGGIKESGLGRELSEMGLKEFSNIKTITLQ